VKEKKITMIVLVTASEETIDPKLKSKKVIWNNFIHILFLMNWLKKSYPKEMSLNCNLKRKQNLNYYYSCTNINSLRNKRTKEGESPVIYWLGKSFFEFTQNQEIMEGFGFAIFGFKS